MSRFKWFRQASTSRSRSELDDDPHSWRLPSSYSTTKSGQKPPSIPSSKIFVDVAIPQHVESASDGATWLYPSGGHAAVHLALLECFRKLKSVAMSLDTVTRNGEGCYSAHPDRQGWDTLLKLAITRFDTWWSNIDRVLIHASAYGHHGGSSIAMQLDENHIPPLDVLLVWYVYILDTEVYHQSCRAREREVPHLHRLCFPWPSILKTINMDNLEYTLSPSAARLFMTLTGQSHDILTYLNQPPAYTDPPAYSEKGTLSVDNSLFPRLQSSDDFINEAHNLLWIRSPALQGSLARAIVDYFNYELLKLPDDKSKPHMSFGIELIARTHRLFPEQYQLFCSQASRVQPEGNEKASTASTNDEPNLGLIPGLCRCWTCERIRDDLPYFVHRISANSSSSSVLSDLQQANQLSSLSSAQRSQIQDDLGFYNAVERARAKGKALPTRPPTAAELAAQKIARERQDEVGYLPGINEYIEILPDGRRQIRRYAHPWY